MKIVRTFDLPNTKLLAVKYDGEELDALALIDEQWSSTEYLRTFFETFQKDYFREYGRSDRAKLVKDNQKTCGFAVRKVIQFGRKTGFEFPF